MSRRDEILGVAEALLEAEGAESLTMRRLATELGMQAPSLYKHVRNKEDIEAGLQDRALRSMGQALTAAGDRLPDLAKAYRSWALAHPRLYELATRRPLRRNELGSGVEAAAAAPIVAAAGGDEHVARTLWGVAHGLVDLELAGRFPPGADIDQTWRTAVETLSSPRRRADPGNGTGSSAVR